MTTVTIQDKYATVLSAFGDIQTAVDTALQRYTNEQIVTKIRQLQQRDREYITKYGMTYASFTERIARDEALVQLIETTITQLWEADLADWEFCVKGIEDWTQTLENILLA
jgi:hypothetical protein